MSTPQALGDVTADALVQDSQLPGCGLPSDYNTTVGLTKPSAFRSGRDEEAVAGYDPRANRRFWFGYGFETDSFVPDITGEPAIGFKIDSYLKIVSSADLSVVSATGTTVRLDNSEDGTDDYYNGWNVSVKKAGVVQTREIIDYVGATRTATVSAWTTTPDNTYTYELEYTQSKFDLCAIDDAGNQYSALSFSIYRSSVIASVVAQAQGAWYFNDDAFFVSGAGFQGAVDFGSTAQFHADLTIADNGVNIILGTLQGTKIGTSASQKLAFHDATPVVQRASADQAAVSTTIGGAVGIDLTDAVGLLNQVRTGTLALMVLSNEIRAALVEKGLIKGAV